MSNQQDTKKKNPNVPNLRFNQDPWFPISIGSLFSPIRNGFVGIATPFYTTADKGVRYLQSTNIHDGHITNDTRVFVTKDFHAAHPKSVLKSDDIVMVQSGHSGECAVVGNEYAGCNCHALIIMSNVGASDSRFISFLLNGPVGRNKTRVLLTGNTVRHILASDMKTVSVNAPSLETQIKIADFLELIDKRIEVQNKIIEELETFEKTFWNCLLNEEGCLLESIGNMFFVSKEKLGSGPQIPVYTASAKEGLIDEERYFKKKVSGNDKSNYQIVRKGDYVFSKSSSRDAPFGAFIRFEDEIGIVSPLYWVLRPKQEIDENLIRIWFSSSFAAKQFQSKCQEGARNHGMLNISLSDFLTIKMWKSLPQPILECKRLINAKLEKAKEQTKLFQQEKSFLLKAMFI